MVTRSKNRLGNFGDIITGYLDVTASQQAFLIYGRNALGATASYTGPGYVLKLILQNTNAALRDFMLYDDGTGGADDILIYKQSLHALDLRERVVYTVEFPEPGLYFNGNLKAVSDGTGIEATIIARIDQTVAAS